MKKIFYSMSLIMVCLPHFMGGCQEFVIDKKTKTKKESAAAVKEEVIELLESIIRQVGANIQQSVGVINQAMDMIRTLVESNQSTAELKEVRVELEKKLHALESCQQESVLLIGKIK